MTPFEIGILLHYYSRLDDHPHVENPPPIWRETVDRLMDLGLLKPGIYCAYESTERLMVYVEALCATPLPVQKWVMEPE